MAKSAIVLDSWKLSIFKKGLDEMKYNYTEHAGLDANTVILQVETEDIGALAKSVMALNSKAARSRLH